MNTVEMRISRAINGLRLDTDCEIKKRNIEEVTKPVKHNRKYGHKLVDRWYYHRIANIVKTNRF